MFNAVMIKAKTVSLGGTGEGHQGPKFKIRTVFHRHEWQSRGLGPGIPQFPEKLQNLLGLAGSQQIKGSTGLSPAA